MFKTLGFYRDIAKLFTLANVWLTSCFAAYYLVNQKTGDSCFYGGIAFFILWIATSPRIKKWCGIK